MPLTGPPFLSLAEFAAVERWVANGLPSGQAAGAPPARQQLPRPGPGDPITLAHVAPIFLKRCAKCHKYDGTMGAPPEGLRLDSYANIMRGGERIAVLPGNAGLSELVRRIAGTARPRTPFDGPPWLNAEDIELLRRWVVQSAANVAGERAPIPAGRPVRLRGILTGHWALDGAPFIVDGGTRLRKPPAAGEAAELRGVVTPDGSVRATRLRRR